MSIKKELRSLLKFFLLLGLGLTAAYIILILLAVINYE
jgi:hypothetical protein